jgi:polyisoprenoid-binding protein YceI
MPQLRAPLATLAILTLLATAAPAAEMALHLDPASSRVTFAVEATGHDVHGTLALQEGEVRFDPASGAASGRIVIDARRAETGNGSRDKTLHKEVLESSLFPSFVFTPERVEGTVPEAGKGHLVLVGTLAIHGAQHPLRLPADVEVDGGRLHATATFPVPYVEWGLHNPSLLFLRVADEVAVSVDARGAVAPATTVAASGGRGAR